MGNPGTTRAATALAAAVGLTIGLSGCGSDPNETDTSWAKDVTEHHAQTVQLINLPLARPVPQAAVAWTDRARERRVTELAQVERMLDGWQEKVPETGLDHADEGKHVTFDPSIPGVLDAADVERVTALRGRAFVDAWLRRLIAHEQGAVTLAQREIDDGANAEAVAFAKQDMEVHQRQVAQLQSLL
ncbi:MAG: DUF305 domain-containing protein [Nocardioidaceae bacterium]|nr:DUF305 domain-containing protein [Nocardioidaceae bacterium]NUS51380.1 DUF305 domain-containing protein [Nocardioidaceae bacterium]